MKWCSSSMSLVSQAFLSKEAQGGDAGTDGLCLGYTPAGPLYPSGCPQMLRGLHFLGSWIIAPIPTEAHCRFELKSQYAIWVADSG